MIDYTQGALDQIAALAAYYRGLGRVEAVRGLDRALLAAEDFIERTPLAGLMAPRPYPQVARTGVFWTLAGRYWVAYRLGRPPVISAVFWDQADIPGRL